MREHLTDLQKKLFGFARTADQINTALRTRAYDNLTDDDRMLIAASDELRKYLSVMARRAERVASCLGVAAEQNKDVEQELCTVEFFDIDTGLVTSTCGGWESHPIHHNKAFRNYHSFREANKAAERAAIA